MKKKFSFIFVVLLIFLSACQTPQAQPTARATHTSSSTFQAPTHTSSPTYQAPTHTNTATPPAPTITREPSQPIAPSATPSRRLTLMAVGDVMLGRTIGDLIETHGFESPFIDTAETLKTADITLGNLECPISDRGDPEEKIYTFRAPSDAGKALRYAGFDLVSLANNHILDYGPLALQDTIDNLTSKDIQAVGAGLDQTTAYQPILMEVNGLRLAFLAFADIAPGNYDYLSWEAGADKAGIAWAHPQRVREGILAAKEQADLVIVLVHNGYEFVETVSRFQQETAKLAIDSGASLVIGSHPHVLQRIEPYHNGLIVYSMGNFVFDNFLFPPNYSAILKIELTQRGVESYELIDVVVQLNGVPQIMDYKREN